MAIPQETLHSRSFQVEIQQPEIIYGLLTYNRTPSGLLPPRPQEVELADTSLVGGLYSRFIVNINAFMQPDEDHRLRTVFLPRLYGFYHDPQLRFSPEEVEQVYHLLSGIHGKSTRHFEVGTFNSFGIDDEFEQMRTIVSLLDFPPEENQEGGLFLSLDHITSPVLATEHIPRKHLLLQDETNFARKIRKWGQYIEDVVGIVGQVKGIPQTGVLALHPPKRADS